VTKKGDGFSQRLQLLAVACAANRMLLLNTAPGGLTAAGRGLFNFQLPISNFQLPISDL
jgi:hypothetical protein